MYKYLAGILADPNNDNVGEPLTPPLTSCKMVSVRRHKHQDIKRKRLQWDTLHSGRRAPVDESLSRPLRQLWKGTHSQVTLLDPGNPKNKVLVDSVTHIVNLVEKIDSVLNDGMNVTNWELSQIPVDESLSRPLRQLWKWSHSEDTHLVPRNPKNVVLLDPVIEIVGLAKIDSVHNDCMKATNWELSQTTILHFGERTPIDETLSRPLRQLWKGSHSEITHLVPRKPKNMVLLDPVFSLTAKIDSVHNDCMKATSCELSQKAILHSRKTISIDKKLSRPLRQLWKDPYSQVIRLDPRKPKKEGLPDPDIDIVNLVEKIDSVLIDCRKATYWEQAQKAVLHFNERRRIDETLSRPLRQLRNDPHSEDTRPDQRNPKNKVLVDPVTYTFSLAEKIESVLKDCVKVTNWELSRKAVDKTLNRPLRQLWKATNYQETLPDPRNPQNNMLLEPVTNTDSLAATSSPNDENNPIVNPIENPPLVNSLNECSNNSGPPPVNPVQNWMSLNTDSVLNDGMNATNGEQLLDVIDKKQCRESSSQESTISKE